MDNSTTTKTVMLVLSPLAVLAGIWAGVWLVGTVAG